VSKQSGDPATLYPLGASSVHKEATLPRRCIHTNSFDAPCYPGASSIPKTLALHRAITAIDQLWSSLTVAQSDLPSHS